MGQWNPVLRLFPHSELPPETEVEKESVERENDQDEDSRQDRGASPVDKYPHELPVPGELPEGKER